MTIATIVLPLTLSLLPASTTALQEGRAEDWVRKLETGSFAESRKALIEMGAREALPALVACVAERPTATGWLAVRVMRDLPVESAPERVAAKAAAKKLQTPLSDPDAERRLVAARALVALGTNSSGSARALANRVSEEESPMVLIACAHALAEIGKDAVKPLKDLLKSKRVMPKAWSLATLAMLGEDASAAGKTVKRLATDEDSFQAFLLYRTALRAHERIEGTSDASEALVERRELESGRHWMTSGSFNWGGIVENTPHGWLATVTTILGLESAPQPSEVALPEKFDGPISGVVSVAEGYQQLLAHLAVELESLRGTVDSGSLSKLEDYRNVTLRVQRLATVLEIMGHLVPEE